MYQAEHPDRHPAEEWWAQERGRVVDKENELEERRFQSCLLTVGEIARVVAQKVHINDVISAFAWIGPSLKYEVFGSRFVAPKSMASRQTTVFGQLRSLNANGDNFCARFTTYGVPAGINRTLSCLVSTYSIPSLMTPSTPFSTLKYSSCKRCRCLRCNLVSLAFGEP